MRRCLVQGKAWIGKSKVITALANGIERHSRITESLSPDCAKVVEVLGATGIGAAVV